VLSPAPPPPGMLPAAAKVTSKDKRDALRKEIRRSIRLSRGLPPVDPEKILDVDIDK